MGSSASHTVQDAPWSGGDFNAPMNIDYVKAVVKAHGVDSKAPRDGQVPDATLLLVAAEKGDRRSVALLLRLGADPDFTTSYRGLHARGNAGGPGRAPFDLACTVAKRKSAALTLLAGGASVDRFRSLAPLAAEFKGLSVEARKALLRDKLPSLDIDDRLIEGFETGMYNKNPNKGGMRNMEPITVAQCMQVVAAVASKYPRKVGAAPAAATRTEFGPVPLDRRMAAELALGQLSQ